MERYTSLYRLPKNQYTAGSPVLLAAGTLLKDTQTGAVLAQLKMQSLSAKPIRAVMVAVDAADVSGAPLEGVSEYQYLDLSVRRDETFGQHQAIVLPDANTRRVVVRCTRVVFADGTSWEAAPAAAWSPLPEPEALSDALGDEELVKQYRLKYGARTKSIPQKHKDLWFCACGALNRADEEVCHVCSSRLASLLIFDAEALKAEKDARLQKEADERRKAEEQAKAAAAEKAAKAKKAVQKAKKIAAIVIPIVCACIAFVILLTQVIIPKQKYNKAMGMIDAGEYDSAYAMLEELGNTEAIAENKYDRAMERIDAQDYETALALLDGIEYKDSEEKRENIKPDYYRALFADTDVGDTIFFGAYEQDNDTSNGEENIEWLVLAKKDNRLLVISQYALNRQWYNTGHGDITWENCTLRRWLNEDFFNTAFSDGEKGMIPTVTVSADKSLGYKTNPGNATQDKVFLLSITEAKRYFKSDEARMCVPTTYAVANGARENSDYTKGGAATCLWWLRSPGDFQHLAVLVDSDGGFNGGGYIILEDGAYVRPAMWISLEE